MAAANAAAMAAAHDAVMADARLGQLPEKTDFDEVCRLFQTHQLPKPTARILLPFLPIRKADRLDEKAYLVSTKLRSVTASNDQDHELRTVAQFTFNSVSANRLALYLTLTVGTCAFSVCMVPSSLA